MFTKGNERLIVRGNKAIVNIDIGTAQRMSKSWDINDIALQYVDKTKGLKGLPDDVPAPVVLWVRKSKEGKLIFEQTEHTNKYLD